jgi:hypothetical protein
MITAASLHIVGSTAVVPNANGTFATFLATALLNHGFVSGRPYTPPTTLYVALYTTNPTPAGGGTEVTGDAAYTRQTVTFSAATGAPATVSNAAQVQWPVATVNWGTITSAGLLDAAMAGHLLAYGLMLAPDGVTPAPKLVSAGDVFMFNTGAFIVGLA